MTTAETVSLVWSPDGPEARRAGDPPSADIAAAPPGPPIVIPARLGSVRLIRELGKGGMGVVWLGHHEFLDRQVAVKFLLATVADRDDPRFQVFLDGARAAAQVRHLGLTAVLHADIVEHVPYLVMEYVRGPTLGEIVERTGPLRVPAVLAVLERVADALDQLHLGGVVHRDVKPSNILVDVQGLAYLTDFGLCCRVEEKHAIQTSGTPAYMAPEMFEGDASARTDIYALAATVYHLLAGRAPYAGSVSALREQHKGQQFPVEPLASVAVPASIAEVLQRAAHPDPAFRTRSARKFLESFREAAGKVVTAAEGADQLARLAAAVTSRGGAGAVTAPTIGQSAPTPGMAQSPDTAPPAPDSQVLAEPVPCIQCGYELRGLPTAARCPECQRPIEHSLDPERLIFADPAWLARITRGTRLLAVALGALALAMLCVPVIAAGREAALLVGTTAAAVLFFAVGVPAYRLAATDEPGGVSREPFRPIPWWAILLTAVLTAMLAAFPLRALRAPGGMSAPAPISSHLLAWLVVLGAAVLPADLTFRMRRLLGRAPRSHRRWLDHAAATIAGVGAAYAMFVAVVAAVTAARSWQTTLRGGSAMLSIGLIAGLCGAAAMAVLAWRLSTVRRRLVTLDLARRRAIPQPAKPDSYYQSLRTFAEKRRSASVDATPEPGTPQSPDGVSPAPVPGVSPLPARADAAHPDPLERAELGFRKAALTFLIGALLFGATIPLLLVVEGDAAMLALIYSPFWFGVALVGADGLRMANQYLGRAPGGLRGARVAALVASVVTPVAMVGAAVWLWSSGRLFGESTAAWLLAIPALAAILPVVASPLTLLGSLNHLDRVATGQGAARRARRAALVLALTPLPALIAAAFRGVGDPAGATTAVLLLVLCSMPAAWWALSDPARILTAARRNAATGAPSQPAQPARPESP